MKTYRDRSDWILDYLAEKSTEKYHHNVSIVDTAFVDNYIEFSGAKHVIEFIGAPKCPQIGRDLAKMYTNGLLNRSRCGLNVGDSAIGFPKWVFCYELSDGWFKL